MKNQPGVVSAAGVRSACAPWATQKIMPLVKGGGKEFSRGGLEDRPGNGPLDLPPAGGEGTRVCDGVSTGSWIWGVLRTAWGAEA